LIVFAFTFEHLCQNNVLDITSISTSQEMGFNKMDIKSEISLLLIPSEEIVTRKEILEECGVNEVAIKLLSR